MALCVDSVCVSFRIADFGNGVVRIEDVELSDRRAPGCKPIVYPLTERQQDAMREAFRLAVVVVSDSAVFDGVCRAVAPGVVDYTVWVLG